MSADEISPATEQPEKMQEDAPLPPAPTATEGPKKRPRLDLSDQRERKRGKSMFGLVLGTLNKAKVEDRERNASEAAKKRQMIDQRLQAKLRKETDSSRRAEEVKKDKTAANRKEEELQLKDSIHKLRRTRLPVLANFLLTSDHIPTDDDEPASKNPLAGPARTHPPPLYYLPVTLTPGQEAFLARRKAEVKEAAGQEWEQFKAERAAGVEEIRMLRTKVLEEQERKKAEREAQENAQTPMEPESAQKEKKDEMEVDDAPSAPGESKPEEAKSEEVSKTRGADGDAKEEAMQADDDDAVEY